MDFLRGLFGLPSAAPKSTGDAPRVVIEVGGRGDDDELAEVSVGRATVPAAIWRDYQRDVQDWSSGVRLEDPQTGRMMTDDADYPEAFWAAGARTFEVAGIQHHTDAQRDDFAVAQHVRLVPDPENPVNPQAMGVRSADGRHLAGYVHDADLDRIRGTVPAPVDGIVTWEHYTWRPRTRIGIRVLVGPSVNIRLLPASKMAAERLRRATAYEKGKEEEWARAAAEREAAKEAAAATRAARAAERERLAAAKAAHAAQVEAWRAEGLCVDCGAPRFHPFGRGRPLTRCEVHQKAHMGR